MHYDRDRIFAWKFIRNNPNHHSLNNSSIIIPNTDKDYFQNGKILCNPGNMKISEYAEQVFDTNIFMSWIRGTNKNHLISNDSSLFNLQQRSIAELKFFLITKILRGVYFVKNIHDLFRIPTKKNPNNAYEYTKYISRSKMLEISKYFCMNEWDDSSQHPYKKYNIGVTNLFENWNGIYKKPSITSIDEIRVASSTSRDKFATFNPQKPIRKGRDLFSIGVFVYHIFT